MDEARKTAAELLKLAPDFTLAKMNNAPYQLQSDHDRIWQALADAGIPRE